MVGVCKVQIHESEEELKGLLLQQKSASDKERIHLLYLLKSEQVESVTQVADLLGRHRTTLERWLHKYREGGIKQLLAPHTNRGRKRHIPDVVNEELQEKLQDPTGFDSYGDIQNWLEDNYGVKVSYAVVHSHVRYRLQSKWKVPRPVSTQRNPQDIALFKKLSPTD